MLGSNPSATAGCHADARKGQKACFRPTLPEAGHFAKRTPAQARAPRFRSNLKHPGSWKNSTPQSGKTPPRPRLKSDTFPTLVRDAEHVASQTRS